MIGVPFHGSDSNRFYSILFYCIRAKRGAKFSILFDSRSKIFDSIRFGTCVLLLTFKQVCSTCSLLLDLLALKSKIACRWMLLIFCIQIFIVPSASHWKRLNHSSTALVREQAKSFVDCSVALFRSLPHHVRNAILIIKAWQHFCIKSDIDQISTKDSFVANEMQVRAAVKKCYLPSYAIATLVTFVYRSRSGSGSSKKIVAQTFELLYSLKTRTEPLHVSLNDFYNSNCWPEFKLSSEQKLSIRDPINPTNNLTHRAHTSVIVKMAGKALRGVKFARMIQSRSFQLIAHSGGLESAGLESGGLLWGSRVWWSTGLGPPISDLESHMPVV